MAMRRRRALKRVALTGFVAALSLAAIASPASASVTIGQLAQNSPSSETSADTDRAQPSVVSGNSYVVPASGGVTTWTLTSWSHNAAADVGQELTMKVFRKVADPLTYTVVGHDGPRSLTPSIVNTFQTRLPVKAGDVLGNNSKSPADNASYFPAPGESFIELQPGLADGQMGTFALGADPLRLNISAVLEPDADQDGFGDETQDQCPANAGTQGPCPVAPVTSAKKQKCKKKKKKHSAESAKKKKCKKKKKK
ncbi:MAG TPA: hypothetical protein VFN72_09090 [Solirubrobacterales bacterium]|nr:hypothetical protein [Solirubrobacterales bacterium]